MGSSITSDIALENKFLSFFKNTEFVIYGVLLLLFTPVIVLILWIVYKKARKRFTLKVNCWFCNKNTTIPYELSNSWDCPHCKQYNGFNKDGDYNKIIPQQFNYKLNEGFHKALRTSVKCSQNTIRTNGFCKLCNINQQLKIQQLASFVPLNENNYYEEIEVYREKLEKAYQLCSKCEIILKQTLEGQEYNLLQNRLNSHKTFQERPKKLSRLDGNYILWIIKKNGLLGLKFTRKILAIFLFLALILHFQNECQFLHLALPDIGILKPSLPILEVLLLCKDKIINFKRELSFVGLLCCFLTLFENRKKKNFVFFLAWGFLNFSCWTTFNGLQVLMSGICIFLSTKKMQHNFMGANKKLGFQQVKKVFPEVYNNNMREESEEERSKTPSILLKNDGTGSFNECIDLCETIKIKEAKQKFKNMSTIGKKKKKAGQKENETESFPHEEKEDSNSSHNFSFVHKPFQNSTDLGNSCTESNEPLSEVFNNLSSLQLGGIQKKSNKPPNFLFANHNFSETKNSSPIIKPAKFIKNFNSSSWTESNECHSRSSTPSSGYSSQKPEKMEPNRNDLQKTMTPVFMNSFSRQSPVNYFDYYDGNLGIYNNINSFSPGFVPFQQYPGALGQTTIYTCSRPTNFPFFFSPWQGYTGQKFSPSSSRFSDASDCDNLFQESSKRFEKNKKSFTFKIVLYYFSIFCNFITMVSLAYFISTGVILVDWKLPKFNFFM